MQQDTQKLSNRLNHLLSNLPVIIVLKPEQTRPNGFKEFRVKRKNNIQWLDFLHQHHTSYSDIEINHDVINSLPESDTKTDIYHYLLIHVLTAEYDQITEEGKRTGDNDEISGSLNFGP